VKRGRKLLAPGSGAGIHVLQRDFQNESRYSAELGKWGLANASMHTSVMQPKTNIRRKTFGINMLTMCPETMTLANLKMLAGAGGAGGMLTILVVSLYTENVGEGMPGEGSPGDGIPGDGGGGALGLKLWGSSFGEGGLR
jgi:hypothetical protein